MLLSLLGELFFYIGLFVAGACLGSFLNLVAWRLPAILEYGWQNQCRDFLGDACPLPELPKPPGLAYPQSHCPGCKTPLELWQNLPLIGFYLVDGRCVHCHMKIPPVYVISEWVIAFGCVALGVLFGPGWLLIAAVGLFCALFTLTVIDLKCQLLPDAITIPLLWAGLLINAIGGFTSLESAVYGAALGYTGPWLVTRLHYHLTGRQGMGYGDFKLLAAIGAWLGWQTLILVLMLATFSGSIAALCIAIWRRVPLRDLPLPFGPFIAAAALFALAFGDLLINVYLSRLA